MRVAVRVDAGPLIGGGHAMRCLTLANALAERGADVTFVAATMPEALEQRITDARHRLIRIPASPELEREGADWHEPPLSDAAQRADARAAESAAGAVDWLVIDHYLLDQQWHSAARRFASKLLVIDDLANRPNDCDLLVDQTFGRRESDYQDLVPPRARVLAGTIYALLRPEFVGERRAALERRKKSASVRRILVSMGTTDPKGISARIVEIVLEAAPDRAVDVVLGSQTPSLQRMQELSRRHGNVTVDVDSQRMAQLMRDADLAIGAAGTTSWERCCLGLPSIALMLAENQRPGAEALHEAGAAVAAETVDEIANALNELLGSPKQLSRMSAAAFAIVDGLGTKRVIEAMLDQPETAPADVNLRRATIDDAETLWLWRNDPVTRKQSRQSEPVAWKDHMRWLAEALSYVERRIFVAEQNGAPVGTIRFDRLAGENADEMSIAVAAGHRGTGIGAAMLKAACVEVHASRIYASVRADNEASRRLFESCGFTPEVGAEPGFLHYVRQVGDEPAAKKKQA